MIGSGPARHVFTVDVEEWFQVLALEPFVMRQAWDRLPSRVEQSTVRLLELLARHDSIGTFFILGWVAERCPQLVQRIADEGHEVASHGCGHRRVMLMTRDEFRADVRRSRELLQDITGRDVLGYRAPNFSIVPGVEWALDILLEEGYRYDSSIFPIRRSATYGYAGSPEQPYVHERAAGRLWELPLTPLRVGRARVPACGGAYFRYLPYALTRRTLQQCAQRGAPGVFYLHPWEVDTQQPRVRASLLTRARQYGGVHRTEPRLERLLSEFRFTTAAQTLGLHVEQVEQAGVSPP